MSYYTRISKSFEDAPALPLNDQSKYVLFSDCHRGNGNASDSFLKNQTLYFAALTHYYQCGYTYIELGDGDELWENRKMEQIIETHSNSFWLLDLFHKQNRLYMIYGNHDIVKRCTKYVNRYCGTTRHTATGEPLPLFERLTYHSGIILKNQNTQKDIYLTHGHQSELLNSVFWRLARFLVRYFWTPLKNFGVLDPTSAAKNYTRKHKSEQRLSKWARQENHVLVTGHTHRPVLTKEDPYYYNTGSCVHPRCITCLEIEHERISLVKWTVSTKADRTMYVAREILAGPILL